MAEDFYGIVASIKNLGYNVEIKDVDGKELNDLLATKIARLCSDKLTVISLDNSIETDTKFGVDKYKFFGIFCNKDEVNELVSFLVFRTVAFSNYDYKNVKIQYGDLESKQEKNKLVFGSVFYPGRLDKKKTQTALAEVKTLAENNTFTDERELVFYCNSDTNRPFGALMVNYFLAWGKKYASSAVLWMNVAATVFSGSDGYQYLDKLTERYGGKPFRMVKIINNEINSKLAEVNWEFDRDYDVGKSVNSLIKRYNLNPNPPAPPQGNKRRSLSVRAGLKFPVARVKRYLKNQDKKMRVSISAGVYLAGVLEYLAVEAVELGGNAARDNKRKVIQPRHILLAIKNDEELVKLLAKVTIPGGGVIPHIHSNLLPGERGKKPSSRR